MVTTVIGYPFDGAGGAVGHAFFPSDPAWSGGVPLDAEEEWVFRQSGGMMMHSSSSDIISTLDSHALGKPGSF